MISLMKNTNKNRCLWPGENPLMIAYHDMEWGVPLFDDQKLFEFIFLDAMQAGLSWAIVLKKREAFRKAFDNFNPKKIAEYDDAKIELLLGNPEIIRNRQKVRSSIRNAHAFLQIQKEYGSFSSYIWSFVNDRPIINTYSEQKDIPARSSESDVMSKALIKRGFSFVGSTICYAFMQAAGMVNDHLVNCFRYKVVSKKQRK